MNERKREELAFRHQPYLDSPEGVLACYIKNNKVRLLKEMVLQALRAYWLALAYQELGGLSPEELQRVGRHCVDELEKQASFIRLSLGLEHPEPREFVTVTPSAVATTISMPSPQPITDPVVAESVEPELDNSDTHDIDGAGDWKDMFAA